MRAEPIAIPSEPECRRLIADMGMLEHIVAHSQQVCRVALLLAGRLELPRRDRELIRAAALLHDITKTRSFRTGEDHAETGECLIRELGYPEVAAVVGQHVRLRRTGRPSAVPAAAEVVNYADKRVLHDRIVPLAERMGYILARYGATPERKRWIMGLRERSEKLEARLFSRLPFAPADVSRLLAEEPHPEVPTPARPR